MNNKKSLILKIVFLIALALIGAVIAIYCFRYMESKSYQPEDDQIQSQARDDIILYGGQEYQYDYNRKNILFMGVDSDEEMNQVENNDLAGQADVVMILSIERGNNQADILQISRDSMTEIDLLIGNEKYATEVAQLAVQYAYGDGREGSCNAMVKTTSELLYNLPIDGYVAMDISGVSKINDYIGGVTLTMTEDYTEIDPQFKKGETITLDGEQAEKFVRYRDLSVIGSNNTRMRRQVQYIPALLEEFRVYAGKDEESIEEFLTFIEPYMVTNLNGDEMKEFMDYNWNLEDVSYVPGETVLGDEFQEFYVDDKELKKILINLFYKPLNK